MAMGAFKVNSKATFGAGCFWGVEAAFSKLAGVVATSVGYMGGSKENPSYEDVCSGSTRHVEVVQVEFNSSISYEKLLETFWKIHDPTQLNRQGVDVGVQYKSVVFYHDENQKEIAQRFRSNIQKEVSGKIVTEILKARKFFRAEEYHQKYVEKHGKNVC